MEVTEPQRRLLELCAIQIAGACADWALLAQQAQADGGLDDLRRGIVWERSAAARRSARLLLVGLRDRAALAQSAALVDAELAAAEAAHARLVTVVDSGYPATLRQIAAPPPFLFYRGELLPADTRSVAVVGTRHPSDSGLGQAAQMAGQLAEYGYTVVSGLAAGIDTAAHEAALEAGARTIAILGTGITRCYPAVNHGLSERITGRGALVSQFWPTRAPAKDNFPSRNVVISGLSQGTVVIEAGPMSGARMQARIALEQDREVFLLEALVAGESWAAAFASLRGAIAVADAAEVAVHLAEPRPATGRHRHRPWPRPEQLTLPLM